MRSVRNWEYIRVQRRRRIIRVTVQAFKPILREARRTSIMHLGAGEPSGMSPLVSAQLRFIVVYEYSTSRELTTFVSADADNS
ncbi:hypothetical protein ACU8KH_04852 [Lachancea thermotolerans]